MHPATRILLFLFSALALPGLNHFGLLLLSLLLVAAAMPRRMTGLASLLWRSRWLFLIILLGYAYHLPGTMVWSVLGEFSPSREGLQAGAAQAARLAVLLLLLERLVLSLPEERLLAGLHGLFRAWSCMGCDAERLTVRLALTLRMMQGRQRALPEGLRELLAEDAHLDAGDALQMPSVSWRGLDYLFLLLGAVLVLLVWLSA